MGTMRTSLPIVQTRKEYMDTLADMNRRPRTNGAGSRGRTSRLKSYLLEANEMFRSGSGERTSWEIVDTGVVEIKILRVWDTGGQAPARQFFLDMSDSRFPLLHTDELARDANDAVGRLVGDHGHKFDHVWFGAGLMEKWAGGSCAESGHHTIGHDEESMARRSIEMVRGTGETPGEHIEEHVSDTGYFAIKRGESIQDHLHMVKEYKEDYKRLVMRIEECGMGEVTSDGARCYGGKPIIVSYPRIDGLGRFIDTLFSAKRPFRLWGLKVRRKDMQYSVPAVDLHDGSAINFEITPEAMRIYLNRGSCGNTVMRLLANMQSWHGVRAKCEDLE